MIFVVNFNIYLTQSYLGKIKAITSIMLLLLLSFEYYYYF